MQRNCICAEKLHLIQRNFSLVWCRKTLFDAANFAWYWETVSDARDYIWYRGTLLDAEQIYLMRFNLNFWLSKTPSQKTKILGCNQQNSRGKQGTIWTTCNTLITKCCTWGDNFSVGNSIIVWSVGYLVNWLGYDHEL